MKLTPVRSFLCATSLLLLANAPFIVAATPVKAASDVRPMADAYGDLTVFMLNVAAGNDGEPQKPQDEQSFKAAFADLFAQGYAGLAPQEQQALETLPLLDTQLHAAWPSVPDDQRNAIRDQWAASVQDLMADAPCDLFDALARAQLLPSYGQYQQVNVNRLRQCWQDHPELTRDSDERASGQNYGKTGRAASAGSHSTYMAMFNASLYSYTASMNSASMGTATYTVKSWP